MSRNKEHRPNGAAAEGARTIGRGASVFFVFPILSFVCFVIYSANRFKSNFLIRGVVGNLCSRIGFDIPILDRFLVLFGIDV